MIKNTENSEHYLWGDNCDGFHLVKTETLSIIQEIMPPKTFENLHKHNKSQQFFYILNGKATFKLDEKEFIVNKGSGFHILPNSKHQIFNNEEENLEFIVVSEPKSHGDRIDY